MRSCDHKGSACPKRCKCGCVRCSVMRDYKREYGSRWFRAKEAFLDFLEGER